MKIVIASGKGGTGKTTLAVNLAAAAAGEGSIGLLDCDVEEPNDHLYLRPSLEATDPVQTLVPAVDAEACTGCGLCAQACAFHALLALSGPPLLLPELCHSCGVCAHVCPEEAISEGGREIGVVGASEVGGLYFRWGRLHVGEARSTPLIRAVKDLGSAPPLDLTIVDAPPGVACPAVEAMRGADFAVLVTEPTPFGLSDLRSAVAVARQLDIACGVVINRAGIGDSRVDDFCTAEGIPVILEIPNDRRIAEACSRGEVFSLVDEAFASKLRAFAFELRARGREEEAKSAPATQSPAFELRARGREEGKTMSALLSRTARTPAEREWSFRQLVVLSGKGGTGKTSVVAALAALSPDKVLADCDVDAADLHLVLDPRRRSQAPFVAGKEAYIVPERCSACGLCLGACRFDAVCLAPLERGGSIYTIDPSACEGCGLCGWVCPSGAVELREAERGECFAADTHLGPLAHARLHIGGENSGKLVTLVKEQALALAEETGARFVVVDGPPGIGCPVIASVAGADLVLVVTEPTVSGVHDLERVADLVKSFGIPLVVCINKVDLNPEMAGRLREVCAGRGLPVVGELSYDLAVVQAQVAEMSVVEYGDSIIVKQLRQMWRILKGMLEKSRSKNE